MKNLIKSILIPWQYKFNSKKAYNILSFPQIHLLNQSMVWKKQRKKSTISRYQRWAIICYPHPICINRWFNMKWHKNFTYYTIECVQLVQFGSIEIFTQSLNYDFYTKSTWNGKKKTQPTNQYHQSIQSRRTQ